MFRKTRIALAIAAAGAAIAVPSSASAACSPSGDAAAPAYNVRLCGVTDIDQFRATLENNGSAYCGPASLLNDLFWFQAKGLPVRINGDGLAGLDPLDQDDYSTITRRLDSLAFHYDGQDGSMMGENLEGFDWATSYARDHGWMTVRGNVTTSTSDFGLELASKLKTAPVQMVYGRYSKNIDGTYKRNGGHILTVVAASGVSGSGEVSLTLHDPARADDHGEGYYLYTQSAPRDEVVTLKKTNIMVADSGGVNWKTVWEVTGNDEYAASTRQMVESFNWFSAVKVS
jgi:hypothetical protein